ncbi:MAG: hypothetical protein NZ803_03785 [Candidatus Nitrosopelagicus sp.]|nr:hypothetical protein [Candidatus Nitrosopelagicus sp.]
MLDTGARDTEGRPSGEKRKSPRSTWRRAGARSGWSRAPQRPARRGPPPAPAASSALQRSRYLQSRPGSRQEVGCLFVRCPWQTFPSSLQYGFHIKTFSVFCQSETRFPLGQ